jgi:type II secretory pathway predicted ATPase ExeA
MYNAHFGFTRRPFAAAPQVNQYFPATAIEAARQTLARCIERAEGAAVVVGPSGTGKTLLCQVLAAHFKDSLKVVLLPSGRLSTRRNLLQAILYELGQAYRGMDEGELRLALVDHLATSEDCAPGVVLLVDEAHSLPLRLFEEIRLLTDAVRQGQTQVRLVMAGGCALEERVAHPRLDSFSQRLVARCYLESLSRTETYDYIQAQVAATGAAAQKIFPAEACRAVYQATDGVPRLVNQVCDHALLLAYAAGRRQLDAAQVEEAWADLQQLPAPSSEESPRDGGSVIEFGGLDDSSADGDQPAARKATLPPLRLLPETDGSDALLDGSARRLQCIEQMLGSVEEDFEPAGSIGPELELVFEDPFAEEFEKEEVVTDHYSPPGELLGDLGSQTAESQHDQTPPTADLPDRQPAEAENDAPEESAPAAAPNESVVAVQETERETLPLHREEPVDEADDDDMVIVEDDSDEASVATCPIVAVRRQEYGRLFTKLRRG